MVAQAVDMARRLRVDVIELLEMLPTRSCAAGTRNGYDGRCMGLTTQQQLGTKRLLNDRASLDAAFALSLVFGRHWCRASEPERWAK
jgi:hypothetical protein